MDQFPGSSTQKKRRRYQQRTTPEEQAALARVLRRILTPEQRAELRDLARAAMAEFNRSSAPKNARPREKRATLPEKS